MKKILAIIAAGLMAVSILSGCGGGKPSDLSDESYALVEKMIDSANMYLNGKITGATAASWVSSDIKKFRDVEEPVSPSDTHVTLIFQVGGLRDTLEAENRDGVAKSVKLLEKTIGK